MKSFFRKIDNLSQKITITLKFETDNDMYIENPVFIPGPTNMPDQIRQAMQVQTFDHRSPAFAERLKPILNDLKKVFKTETAEVFTFPASGTGGWEAAVTNTLSPGDQVLVARYGMFSHRWIELCQRHGLEVEIIECQWGSGAPAERFAERLTRDSEHQIKALLVTHNETATGVLSDIAAVRKALDDSAHPAMLYVDCVSSLASMDFRMDEWGVDLAVSGSQKGFMLATGLAIVAASRKALSALDGARCPRSFFDFRDMLAANKSGGYPYTPPIQIFNGLRVSLDLLLDEGLDNVFARHHRIAEGIRRAGHGQRDLRPRRFRQQRPDRTRLQQIRRFLRHRPRRNERQGVSHRSSRRDVGCHGIVRPFGDGNGDEGFELRYRSGIRRRRGTGVLPR